MFDVTKTFLCKYNDIMIQLKKQLQHSHPHSNLLKEGSCLHQQSHLPCQSTTPSSCSYSYLVSSMSLFCVPIDCRFTFDLVTLETVLCFMSTLPTYATTELELCHNQTNLIFATVNLPFQRFYILSSLPE